MQAMNENILKEAVPRYLKAVTGPLKIRPPIKLVIGVEGIQNYCMINKFNRMYEDWRHAIIHDNSIISEITIENLEVDPENLTAPFLNKLWDAAGLERPENYVPNAPVLN